MTDTHGYATTSQLLAIIRKHGPKQTAVGLTVEEAERPRRQIDALERVSRIPVCTVAINPPCTCGVCTLRRKLEEARNAKG